MAEQKSDEYLEIAAFFKKTLQEKNNISFAAIEAFNYMIGHCKSKSFEGIRQDLNRCHD
jgi:hypothetical protein